MLGLGSDRVVQAGTDNLSTPVVATYRRVNLSNPVTLIEYSLQGTELFKTSLFAMRYERSDALASLFAGTLASGFSMLMQQTANSVITNDLWTVISLLFVGFSIRSAIKFITSSLELYSMSKKLAETRIFE